MTSKIAAVPDEPNDDNKPINPFAPELHRVSGPSAVIRSEQAPAKEHKPRKDEFFRIHPSPDYVDDWWLLVVDDGMEKERYVVLPEVRPLIDGNMQAHRLFVGMNLHDAVFIWPVRLPDGINDGGRTWSESALICADQAKSMWIKIRGNRSAGAYEKQVAEGKLDEPKWPAKSFTDLVSEAYKGKVVDRPDHPVIRKLSGDQK